MPAAIAAGASIAASVAQGVGGVLDDLFTSDDERQKNAAALAQIQQLPILRELDRQIAEAQHPTIFVAGARPAMLWGAAAGVAWQFVLQPVLAWLLAVLAWWTGEPPPPLPPQLDLYEMIALLLGGGGLYRLRGVEKERGVARENLLALPPPAKLASLDDWRARR